MFLEDLISNKLFLLTIVIATGLLYFPLNRRKSKYYWESKIDRKIPLIPIFIIPYIYLFFPYVALGFVFLWNTAVVTNFLESFIVANILADIIWYLFPNGVRRPEIKVTGFWEKIVKKLYKIDKFDTNGFPSSHVYCSSITTWYLILAFPQYWLLFLVVGISIIFSTLFVKQHYVVDVVGGLIIFLISVMV
mgnify:FL=1